MPTPQPELSLISEADYLAGEQSSEIRHEFVDGHVVAMAGSSLRHNDIALNLAFALRNAAQNSPCRVNVSDVKVRIEQSRAYYYPDVVVGCEQDNSDAYYMDKPCLIIEVTSKSTQWRDFTEKALAYQKIASLQAYLVVSQDEPQVTLYHRDNEGVWQVKRYDDVEQEIPLPCPGMMLSVADVYTGV